LELYDSSIFKLDTFFETTKNFEATTPLNNHVPDAVVAADSIRFLAHQPNAWPNLPKIAQNESWIFGVNSPYS
jgi:hypothetical protein